MSKNKKANWRNKKLIFAKFNWMNEELERIKQLHEAIKNSLIKK